MKNVLSFLLLLVFCDSFCQERNAHNQLGVSMPVLWNRSEATFYSLGRPKHPSGKGFSYSLNINYSRSISKSIYTLIGIGYFRQVFGIVRPFHYNSMDDLLYHTQSYYYDNMQIFGGIGYCKELNKITSVKAAITYNTFNSFRQKYTLNKEHKSWQVNNKSMSTGNVIYINAGLEKNVTEQMSIGASLLVPVLTSWNKDSIFYKYDYSDDTQKIAKNKFSIGITISCCYHF